MPKRPRASVRVSVVIPVYNTAPALLHASVRSVERQVVSNGVRGELIVVDDGSDRVTRRTARGLCLRLSGLGIDARYLPLVHHEGMAAARNAGAAEAIGDYVLFLDSDDALTPNALKALGPALESRDAALVFADHANTTFDGEIEFVRRKAAYADLLATWRGSLFDPFLHATFLIHPQVVRRDAFHDVGGLRVDLGYGDEIQLHVELSQRIDLGTVVHVPDLLYLYRKNPDSVVHHSVLYARLISNISASLLDAARRWMPELSRCERIGRANETGAAHYGFAHEDGRWLDVPWFDRSRMELCGN